MARFRVKAATNEGKLIFREVEAPGRDELSSSLEKEGLFPIEVRPLGIWKDSIGSFLKMKKGSVGRAEFLVLNRGLVSLLKSGLPVVECMETMAHQASNYYFKSVIEETVNYIRGGQSMSEAMEHNPRAFPPLYTASIKAGERTGDLVPSIVGYINYQARIEAIRKKVISSVTYPAVLTLASSAVIAFLIIHVVPTFSKIYLESGAPLPLASRILIVVSSSIRRYFLFIFGFAILLGFFIRAYLKSDEGRRYLDNLKLSFPQLGEIYRGYVISKFSRTLAMVLRSGLHLIHALEMSRGVLSNRVLEERLDYVIKKAKEGEQITRAMGEADFMPEISLRMLGVGERAANLSEVLTDISDFHDSEVDHKVGIITTLIEPALMVIMGLVIGTIVILLYLPIFQLGAGI